MRAAFSILLLCVLGCASGNRPAGLPGGARLVAESPNPIRFTAPAAGTAYLRDADTDRVLSETRLEPGQQFNPDSALLKPNVHYELYFKPATKREYHPSYNP
jgi:hypothetical protein